MSEIRKNQEQPQSRDNTKWQQAADFLATARDKQRRRGKALRGRAHLSDAEYAPIKRALEDRDAIHEVAKYLDERGMVARQLFDYFGEMCRRNSISIPMEISREIHFILAVELLANMEELNANPSTLIAATAQHGVMGLGKNPKFAEAFSDKGVYLRAATRYPSDPEAFLTGVLDKIRELENDERFASLRDSAWIFKHAATIYPSDPEAFLFSFNSKVAELEKDDRFESLRDTAWIFKHAAVRSPANPESFLTDVIDQIGELEKNEQFASLRATPGVFRQAAVFYSSDPEAFLTTLMARKRISKTDESQRGI